MRYMNIFFGIALAALTLCTNWSVSLGQEEGRRGQAGGGTRGGTPGGFTGRGGSSGILGLLRMEEVQKELELTEEQKKELTAMGERLRESFRGAGGPGGGGPGGGGPGGGPGGGGRPEGGRPEGGRPEGGRPEGGRPEGGRPGQGGVLSEEQMKQIREAMAKAEEARNKAEAEVMTTILDPAQGDRVLGLLIQKEDGRSLSSNVLADTLGLSAEQKEKLKSVTENNRDELRKTAESAMRGGGGFTQELREKMDSLSKKLNTDMIAVMTPEQKAKFEAMKGSKFTFPEQQGFGFPGGGGGGDRTRGGRPGGEGSRPGSESGQTARPSRPE